MSSQLSGCSIINKIEFVERFQMGHVIQGVCGVGVHRKPDVRKFFADGGDVVEIFAGLDFQLDALIAAAKFFFDAFDQRGRIFPNAERNAAGNFVQRAAEEFGERNTLDLGFRVPQGIFHAALGHFVAANVAPSARENRRRGHVFPTTYRSDEIGKDIPGRVGGFGIVAGRFPAVTSPQPLTPSATTSTNMMRRS